MEWTAIKKAELAGRKTRLNTFVMLESSTKAVQTHFRSSMSSWLGVF